MFLSYAFFLCLCLFGWSLHFLSEACFHLLLSGSPPSFLIGMFSLPSSFLLCSLQCFHFLIEFSFQILNYLRHFLQLGICIFLNVAEVFLFSSKSSEVFVSSLNSLHSDEAHACSYKFCVLGPARWFSLEPAPTGVGFDGRHAVSAIQAASVLTLSPSH